MSLRSCSLVLAVVVALSTLDSATSSTLPSQQEIASKYPCLAASQHSVKDRRNGFETIQPRYMGNDGKPFALTLPYKKGTVIWCLNKKVGSTRWKQLLHRHMGVEDWQHAPPHRFTTYRNWEHSMWEGGEKPEFEMPEEWHPRFLFVRSPFNRLLSAYLNKIAPQRHSMSYVYTEAHPTYPIRYEELGANPKDFATFVMDLWGHVGRYGWASVNGHFQPIMQACGLPDGFEYDFILKTEEIESWYPDLVRMLGLQPSVIDKWLSVTGNASQEIPEEDCFFHGAGESCSDMAKRFERQSVSSCQHGSSHMPSTIASHYDSGKATGADGKMKEFYTPSLVRVVALLYRRDIDHFGYGVPGEL